MLLYIRVYQFWRKISTQKLLRAKLARSNIDGGLAWPPFFYEGMDFLWQQLPCCNANEGESVAEAICDCLDYGKNPEKTEDGKYISSYECDPATVAAEFLLAKASYKAVTGREQKKGSDVICYQIRQSFYPGEITPEEANRVSYELAIQRGLENMKKYLEKVLWAYSFSHSN